MFMSVIMTSATAGSLTSLTIYAASFLPFFILMAYEDDLALWHKLVAVSTEEQICSTLIQTYER